MNEQIKPTPGNWTASPPSDTPPFVYSYLHGNVICDLGYDETIPHEERLANAHLIAAAPKLLAFAKSFLDASGPSQLPRLLREAQAVVDEVEGK